MPQIHLLGRNPAPWQEIAVLAGLVMFTLAPIVLSQITSDELAGSKDELLRMIYTALLVTVIINYLFYFIGPLRRLSSKRKAYLKWAARSLLYLLMVIMFYWQSPTRASDRAAVLGSHAASCFELLGELLFFTRRYRELKMRYDVLKWNTHWTENNIDDALLAGEVPPNRVQLQPQGTFFDRVIFMEIEI